MEKPPVNRLANSSLKTIDLEQYFPRVEMVTFDLKDYLYEGLILREKEFRAALSALNKEIYQNKTVLVFCSTDAIIPVWAYMLVAAEMHDTAREIFFGRRDEYLSHYYQQMIAGKTWEEYRDLPVVIKGCGSKPVPPSAYMHITARLMPVARSVMYGEACSTVPVSKRKKDTGKSMRAAL